MDRFIQRAEFLPKTNEVQLSWKNTFTDTVYSNATYDYVMVSAPFSKVRRWRFPNTCEFPKRVKTMILLNQHSVRPHTHGRNHGYAIHHCLQGKAIPTVHHGPPLTNHRSRSNSQLASGSITPTPSLAAVPHRQTSRASEASATPAITSTQRAQASC